MDTKLVELENSLIQVFPARLQKDPYTKIQFKEYEPQHISREVIDKDVDGAIKFDIKGFDGKNVNFIVFLVEGKYFIARKNSNTTTDEKCKKIKDVVKYVEKESGLK